MTITQVDDYYVITDWRLSTYSAVL